MLSSSDTCTVDHPHSDMAPHPSNYCSMAGHHDGFPKYISPQRLDANHYTPVYPSVASALHLTHTIVIMASQTAAGSKSSSQWAARYRGVRRTLQTQPTIQPFPLSLPPRSTQLSGHPFTDRKRRPPSKTSIRPPRCRSTLPTPSPWRCCPRLSATTRT